MRFNPQYRALAFDLQTCSLEHFFRHLNRKGKAESRFPFPKQATLKFLSAGREII